MKAVVAAFNQEKALVGAFSVITNLWMELFEALVQLNQLSPALQCITAPHHIVVRWPGHWLLITHSVQVCDCSHYSVLRCCVLHYYYLVFSININMMLPKDVNQFNLWPVSVSVANIGKLALTICNWTSSNYLKLTTTHRVSKKMSFLGTPVVSSGVTWVPSAQVGGHYGHHLMTIAPLQHCSIVCRLQLIDTRGSTEGIN